MLFRYLLPAPWAREGWLTPGGAIDPGETPAQAAARELAEETGCLLPAASIGLAVAVTSGRWHDATGTTITTASWYFFARAGSSRISLSGQGNSERRSLLRHRWWNANELCETSDLVLPVGLAGLVPRLLGGERPQGPVHLPWT